MKINCLTPFVLLLSIKLFSQLPTERFNHYSINDKTLGTIEYHVTKKNIEEKMPILIWLDGSGCDPLFTIYLDSLGNKSSRTTIFIPYDSLSNFYHIVVISKPGVPFSVINQNINYKNDGIEKCGEVYNNYLSLVWRAEATSKVINDVLSKLQSTNKIIVAGHSEGANVAAKVATLNSKITHIGFFSSHGLNQYYDFIIKYRKLANVNQITPDSAQKMIEKLLSDVKAITIDPNATNKFWQGHTYKRWSSFTKENPVEQLLSLSIPIYAVNGTEDENAMGESLDILPLLFTQNSKTNLTFKTCLDCNHWYQKIVDGKKVSFKYQVFKAFFDWVDNH